jgi:hypothetical protein
MKTKEQIKKDILNALGNPTSGIIVDNLDTIVSAVVGDENKAEMKTSSSDSLPAKETRILEATEKR